VLDDGSADREGDAGCWQAADEWYKTFGNGDYETEEEWLKHFASSANVTEEILRRGLYAHWAPRFRQWGVYHTRYNPAPTWHRRRSAPSHIAQIEQQMGEILSACAKLVSGVCGISYAGGAAIPGAGFKVSGDFYVDQTGAMAFYATAGAGPHWVLGLIDVNTGSVSFVAVPNASANDMGGWSAEVGGSAKYGVGLSADMIWSINGQGAAPTGISIPSTGVASGYGIEAHAILTYSHPLYQSAR
jgi:hypothetical protein